MKNIIIGLCAALVLYGAQTFGCGHDECREKYWTSGTIDGALVWNPVYRTPCTKSVAATKWMEDEEIFGIGGKNSSTSLTQKYLEESREKNRLSYETAMKASLPKDFEDFLKPVLVSTATTEARTASSLVTETTEAGAASAALSQTTDK